MATRTSFLTKEQLELRIRKKERMRLCDCGWEKGRQSKQCVTCRRETEVEKYRRLKAERSQAEPYRY